jgi:hypothetical protein
MLAPREIPVHRDLHRERLAGRERRRKYLKIGTVAKLLLLGRDVHHQRNVHNRGSAPIEERSGDAEGKTGTHRDRFNRHSLFEQRQIH